MAKTPEWVDTFEQSRAQILPPNDLTRCERHGAQRATIVPHGGLPGAVRPRFGRRGLAQDIPCTAAQYAPAEAVAILAGYLSGLERLDAFLGSFAL